MTLPNPVEVPDPNIDDPAPAQASARTGAAAIHTAAQ